jgi:hypothetical protein
MAFRIIRLVFLGLYSKLKLILNIFSKSLNKTLIVTVLTLSGTAKAYIPDRCDWLDCEAMATGTDEGSGFGLLIIAVIGLIILANSK